MDSLREIHANSLYYDFMLIEKRAYREKIKFFEKNRDQIRSLDTDFETEIWYYYTLATFEIGDYKKFISLSNHLLEKIIMENIGSYNGEDAYEKILFIKGACHLNMKEYKVADYIFQELIKINPRESLYPKAFFQSRFMEKIKDNMSLKLFTAIMLFCIISFCLIEMLVINPFYPEAIKFSEIIRSTLTMSLFGIIFLFAGFHFITAKRQIRKLLLSKKT